MGTTIRVELYGVPRLRAGAAALEVPGENVGEALAALARACPGLAGGVVEVEPGGRLGRVRPSYRLSLNGDRFVSDPTTPLVDGDALLLLAADVGG